MSAVFSGSVSFKSDGYLAEKCSVSINFIKLFISCVIHVLSDLDECNSTTARHKCEHICVNTVGSYACACKPGNKLQMDGLSCKGEPHV